jgi:hypothetical protein
MDCVLEGTKEAVLAENETRKETGINQEPFLLRKIIEVRQFTVSEKVVVCCSKPVVPVTVTVEMIG